MALPKQHQTTLRGSLLISQRATGGNGRELTAALLRQTRVAPHPALGPSRLGLGPTPSPGVAGGACARGRERTSLQSWGLCRALKDLGGYFRSARTVAYLLEGRSAACAWSWAGCASRSARRPAVQRRGSRESPRPPAASRARVWPGRRDWGAQPGPVAGRTARGPVPVRELARRMGKMRLNCWGKRWGIPKAPFLDFGWKTKTVWGRRHPISRNNF